jgi:hypothetical protein
MEDPVMESNGGKSSRPGTKMLQIFCLKKLPAALAL